MVKKELSELKLHKSTKNVHSINIRSQNMLYEGLFCSGWHKTSPNAGKVCFTKFYRNRNEHFGQKLLL